MDNCIYITEKTPEKNKHIVALDEDGNIQYCFRCACSVNSCMDFRCSITGHLLFIKLIKWKYYD